jgi:hypothetical protein
MCGCGCGCGSDDEEKEVTKEVAMVPLQVLQHAFYSFSDVLSSLWSTKDNLNLRRQ